MSVDEQTIELAGSPVFFRSAPTRGVPALYLHGVPTSSDDWVTLLERTGGIAPDLIGFGRSGKGGHLDYTIEGLASAVEPLLKELGRGPVAIVGQDWGAVIALELALRRPTRMRALVLCNPLPLIEGFAWPRPARMWRVPVLGELMMGATTKGVLGRALRRGSSGWTDEMLAGVWEHFDQGTQRAILRLHRHTDAQRLDMARERLRDLEAPVLVLWGEQDPWLAVTLAESFTGLFAHATLERLAGTGHWPWLDRPELIDRVASFLESS